MFFICGLFLCWIGVFIGSKFKDYDLAGRLTFHLGFFFMLYSVVRFIWIHLP